MARIRLYGFDELIYQLEAGSAVAREAAETAVYRGAGIVADRVKSNLRAVLSSEASGQLYDSLGITSIDYLNGSVNARVGFDGYDSTGTPNALKATVLERGSSKQPKRPFMRPAFNSTRRKVQKVMAETYDEVLKKSMKG